MSNDLNFPTIVRMCYVISIFGWYHYCCRCTLRKIEARVTTFSKQECDWNGVPLCRGVQKLSERDSLNAPQWSRFLSLSSLPHLPSDCSWSLILISLLQMDWYPDCAWHLWYCILVNFGFHRVLTIHKMAVWIPFLTISHFKRLNRRNMSIITRHYDMRGRHRWMQKVRVVVERVIEIRKVKWIFRGVAWRPWCRCWWWVGHMVAYNCGIQ